MVQVATIKENMKYTEKKTIREDRAHSYWSL